MVKKMLRAMPSKFLHIVSTLEQFGNLETLSIEEVVGSLKSHEERLKASGESEINERQLMLMEEEWQRRENSEGKLLLTREDWLRKAKKKEIQMGLHRISGVVRIVTKVI